jgi:hypothetical protein
MTNVGTRIPRGVLEDIGQRALLAELAQRSDLRSEESASDRFATIAVMLSEPSGQLPIVEGRIFALAGTMWQQAHGWPVCCVPIEHWSRLEALLISTVASGLLTGAQ